MFSTSDSKNTDVLLLSKVRFSDIFMRADAREPLIGSHRSHDARADAGADARADAREWMQEQIDR